MSKLSNLDDLLARESIRDLVSRYNSYGDTGRFEPLFELFAEHAVMETGKGQYVFVDKGEGYLEPRLVKTGAEVDRGRIITDGLREGERVATAANFILDSESRLKGAFEAMIAGKLNVTVECNPLLGPQFFETALKLANGTPIEKWVKSKEDIYRQDTAAQELPKRKY